ncbi:MAG: radical SAM protein [Thermodesulfobacteriota bacterium]|nr:radical SAM protein [Thermodesulfobacteriota bacterium]
MKVLIISGTFLPLTSSRLQMSPSGAAYIAGAARKEGHTVEIFDCYVASNLIEELKKKLSKFRPDVIGISITIVTSDIRDEEADFGTKYIDMRPKIKSIVDTIKQNTNAHIILGGPGFNYYAKEWLDYLSMDYGIRGEGEYSFPLYLNRLEKNGDISSVPGCIFRKAGEINKVARDLVADLDDTAFPAYDLFESNKYNEQNIAYALYSKRGCGFRCTFCPHSSLEGTRYRLKSPERVIKEIKHVMKTTNSGNINFSDNSFNCPKKHAEAICKEIIDRQLKIKWRSGAIKPLGITKDFCRLMKESGCDYVGLSIETASEKMLANMKRGYRTSHIREALSNLSNSDIPFGLSILIGAPGETPKTISETFSIVDSFPMTESIWINIGLYLWTHHQNVLDAAKRDGQLKNERELFDGAYYISPELPKDYMISLIESLKTRENCAVQVNKPYWEYRKRVNSLE